MEKLPTDYGRVLSEVKGNYAYTRVPTWVTPWNKTTFYITTSGVVFFSSNKTYNPLDWDKIKEPDASDAHFWGDIDVKGTATFGTPISDVVTGQSKETFFQVPTVFYYMIIAARNVVNMFDKPKDSDVSWKELALIVWAEKFKVKEEGKNFVNISKRIGTVSRAEYITGICEWRIKNELFKAEASTRAIALRLYEEGAISSELFRKPKYECKREILRIIKENEAEQNTDSNNNDTRDRNSDTRDRNRNHQRGSRGFVNIHDNYNPDGDRRLKV